jgi:glucose/mannose-6-phosphate isomerase
LNTVSQGIEEGPTRLKMSAAQRLDDLGFVHEIDPAGFLGSVETLADQVRDGARLGRQATGLPDGSGFLGVAILGLGGSGISGDICRAVLGGSSPVFLQTVKGYALPAWVGPTTLVFAVSYSGDTEETLEAFEAALRRKARVMAVASGGRLLSRAANFGLPTIQVPGGLQPRAAIGYLAMPLLVVCERLGLGPDMASSIAESARLLEARATEYGREAPVSANAAKRLALQLLDVAPLIYGSDGPAEVAAYRWKCELNEVAKVPAVCNVFPELNHNEVVGWGPDPGRPGDPRDGEGAKPGLIVLRHDGEHPRIARRIEVTLSMLGSRFSLVEQVRALGSSVLARLLDLCYLGDFTSTYLALARGVDPTPVEVIERLKQSLG